METKLPEKILNRLKFKPYDKKVDDCMKVGKVVKTTSHYRGGEIEILLVGDVNSNGGLCDCCEAFSNVEILEIADIFDLVET